MGKVMGSMSRGFEKAQSRKPIEGVKGRDLDCQFLHWDQETVAELQLSASAPLSKKFAKCRDEINLQGGNVSHRMVRTYVMKYYTILIH